MAIQYVKGDATVPQAPGNKIIAHVCNDAGRWGKGFVLAISKRWPEPEREYRAWYASGEDFALGSIQLIQVEPELFVCNMIGQHGIRTVSDKPPIRYEALDECLERLAQEAKKLNASIHMPRIGCGLAGGTWERVEPLIIKRLHQHDVYVYDL